MWSAENGFVPFATRYTGGTDAGYLLENIVSLKLSNAIGLGITTPQAYLHIKAGSATVAPVKLTAGTALTTPQNGTVEYVDDGTTGHWYMSMNVAGVATRREISFT